MRALRCALVLGWLRSWQGGCAVSAVCCALGVLRLALGRLDVLTWLLLALAASYAVASWLDRGHHTTQPGIRRRGRRATGSGTAADPTPWTTEPNRLAAWFAAEQGYALHPGERPRVRSRHVTRDRVGAGLVAVAAVIGFALVLHDHQRESAGPTSAPPSAASAEHPGR